MTREELAQEVNRLTGSAAIGAQVAESSWGTLLRPAAFAGHLCFAPSVGQRVRFTRPDTWLAARAATPIDAQSATAEVTRRFLAAYGPATSHDFARWWNGGGVVTGRQWIAALGDEVSPVDVDGVHAWMLAADVRKMRGFAPERTVNLLPGFDQYVVGASHHAEHLLPAPDLRRLVFRPQGWISPVLLVNGRMEGTWRHQIKGSRVEVVIDPFVSAPQWVRRAASQEAERLAAFLGCALQLSWTNPGAASP